eukprot:6683855-Heterocapsa_arctica.AAC.1
MPFTRTRRIPPGKCYKQMPMPFPRTRRIKVIIADAVPTNTPHHKAHVTSKSRCRSNEHAASLAD